MNITRPMIGLALLGIGIVLITIRVYLAAYKKRANRKLAEGISGDLVEDKPMISPIMMGIVTFLATVTIVYLLMIILVGLFSKASRANEGISQPYIHYYSFTEEDRKDTFLDGTKVGEPITGYNMYTEQQGDIKFTYYVNKMPYSGISAQVLLAYEYTGELDVCETADSIRLTQTDSKFGSYGAEYDPNCLTALTIDNFQGTMELEVGVYDKPVEDLVKDEDKGGYPCLPAETALKYANEKETLSIDWSRLEDLSYAN